jgi:hypothetical protein
MKKMITFAMVLGLGGLAACGGGDTGTMNKLKDRMCACTDQKCYDDVKKDEKDFEKTLESKYKDPKDAPKDLTDAYEAYEKCKDTARDKISSSGSASGAGSASGSGSATP